MKFISIAALSIERYGAFAAPPKHRSSAKNRACVGNLVIWILGCLCGLPMAMFAKEQSFFIDGETDKTIVSSFSTSTSGLLPYRKKNLNISLVANLLNLNSAHYNNFRYVSMTVYMIEIEKTH